MGAQVDPFRLTHQLIQAAKKQGLRVYGLCEVSKVAPSDDGVVLHTGQASNQWTASRFCDRLRVPAVPEAECGSPHEHVRIGEWAV